MMSVRIGGGHGGHGNADIVREVAWFLLYKSDLNVDKGETGKKNDFFQKFCGCRFWKPQLFPEKDPN